MNNRPDLSGIFGMGLMIGFGVAMIFVFTMLSMGRFILYSELVEMECGWFDVQTGEFVLKESPAAITDK